MKNLIYISILLITSIGYGQNKVSAKSGEPVKEVFVKIPLTNVKTISKKEVVKNEIILQKQTTPIENKIINYIGTPKTTYIEPVVLQKKTTPIENKVIDYIGTPKTTYIEPVAAIKKEELIID